MPALSKTIGGKLMTIPAYYIEVLDLIPMRELEDYLDERRAKALKVCEVTG